MSSICDPCQAGVHGNCDDAVRLGEFYIWADAEAEQHADESGACRPGEGGNYGSARRSRREDIRDVKRAELENLRPYSSCFCQHTVIDRSAESRI